MSLWEFNAVCSGWSKSQGAGGEDGEAAPPTEDQFFKVLEEMGE
jgi:hypothetical protein